MKIAVKGAAKFFIEHVKSNSVPYALFKSILERQIEWAAKRGRNITFQDLAEAVRAEFFLSQILRHASTDNKQEHEITLVNPLVKLKITCKHNKTAL